MPHSQHVAVVSNVFRFFRVDKLHWSWPVSKAMRRVFSTINIFQLTNICCRRSVSFAYRSLKNQGKRMRNREKRKTRSQSQSQQAFDKVICMKLITTNRR